MAVDCLMIGGGVIGLTTAWKLAQQGHFVRVVDQSAPGREASWAGAGILPPGHLGMDDDPLIRLTAATCSLWPRLSSDLLELTGIDNEFHRCGGVQLASGPTNELPADRSHWEAIGAKTEWLEPAALRELEPAFSGREAAFLLPDLRQVRNPRHMKALLRACELSGVEITANCPVTGWTTQQGRITAAVTPLGEIAAGQFCVTAGAWSSQLLARAGVRFEVVPVRGQIVLLKSAPIPFSRVIERGKRYLVPRRDGRVLIGSTEEWVGFAKDNTDDGVQNLLDFAAEIFPSLRDAPVEQYWSGLRPSASRGRPFVGVVPGQDNLFVATGHFRAGLHLSPATAELLIPLMRGNPPAADFSAFAI